MQYVVIFYSRVNQSWLQILDRSFSINDAHDKMEYYRAENEGLGYYPHWQVVEEHTDIRGLPTP